MKIPWKGLAILAVLAAAIAYNIPTVLSVLPQEEGSKTAQVEQQFQRIKQLYKPLKEINLALVEIKNKRLMLMTEEGFEYPVGHPILEKILEDNFRHEKTNQGDFLYLREGADKSVFLSHIADKLNGLFTNVRKIEKLSLSENKTSVVFEMQEGKRLNAQGEPLQTFLDDKLEVSYREEENRYYTRPKPRKNVISRGLDLQGGMYMDIGVKSDAVVDAVLTRMVEDLEDVMIEEAVNYVSVSKIDNNQIEIVIEEDESFELQGDAYERLLGAIYDSEKTESGYLVTLKEDEITRIKRKAIEQALETIRNRIDQLGVREPSIQLQGDNSIIIQLPGLEDPDQARRVIGTTAVLEFMLVANNASVDNPGNDNVVLMEEIRDPLTKEVVSTRPYVLEKKVLLQGDRIRDSRVSFSQTGQASVSLSLDDKGKRIFADITRNNVGRLLAIVLDSKVQSAPRINEEIAGGEAVITGNFSPEEAAELALVLRSGALPAPIEINEERTVGPSLGEDSIRKSIIALAIGFAAVIFFMMIYYEVAGMFAVMALLFNLSLIAAALAYFQATLTLPGMAGIILTIGMAVDANVLIFERIREEIGRGSPIRTAVNTGFKKATVTILDANITTVLAAVVLFQFGTGAIKGFSVTLIIGIIASMFTSIIVGRSLFELVYLRKQRLEKISI
ncbi:MAG: protein translocase subunit SecD [Proteobacteria bacterium]|nr:protein translocase subunit SecD [Pseudomonadota bacterium]